MENKKKLLSIFLCGAMALSMVGCDSIESKEDKAKNQMLDAWNEWVANDGDGTGIEIGDDNSYIFIDTNPDNVTNEDNDEPYHYENNFKKIRNVLSALDFPDATIKKILETSSFEGEKSDKTDKFTVTWTYTYYNGLEVMFEANID